MVQNWLNLVLGLVVMGIATMLTALAVKTRSNSGFTGASLVTLMSFGEMLTVIVMFMTQLETSLGMSTYWDHSDLSNLVSRCCNKTKELQHKCSTRG